MYTNYQSACNTLQAKPLADSQTQLCLSFVSKILKSENSLFDKINFCMDTKNTTNLVREYKCNNVRSKPSMPYMARLINEKNGNKYK